MNLHGRHTGTQIESVDFNDSVLTVTCSGIFGVGSEGNPSGTLLMESIERWMLSHPGKHVDRLVVDYADVEYSYGDGPVSSVVPFIKKGITKVSLIAGRGNLEPLQQLVRASQVPWIVVEGPRD